VAEQFSIAALTNVTRKTSVTPFFKCDFLYNTFYYIPFCKGVIWHM